MCYVSTEGRSRDAREDEVLVVSRGPHGVNWLVSPDDISTAVCLRKGTEVELLYIPEVTQQQFRLPQEAKARFKMEHWWRRDLFVFQEGQRVPLQKLQSGQVVRVLGQTASNQKEIPFEKERTDRPAEVGSIQRPMFKRHPSGVPSH